MPSAPESPDHIHHEGEDDAEQNAGRQRKIECRVFAAIDDVTRKASDREIGFAEQNQEQAHYQQHAAQEDKQFAHVCHQEKCKPLHHAHMSLLKEVVAGHRNTQEPGTES
jgi:hypothetical protein